ncbi:MAG: hypothetical protein AB7O24_28415 [Kofleriaceae bacterium]
MSELVRAPGRIKRVMPGMVSVEIDHWATTTVRWRDPNVAIGDSIVVEGYPDPRLSDHARSGLRVCFIDVTDGEILRRIKLADPPRAAMVKPVAVPRWVSVLVRYGLLDTAGRLDRSGWSDPQTALRTRWMPREAINRGLVHYGWRWRNDTLDPIADLSAIGGLPPVPALAYKLDTKLEHDPIGQLEAAAAAINRELSDWRSPRRVWIWDTAADWVIFLGRTPAQIAQLRHDGIGNGHTLRAPR